MKRLSFNVIIALAIILPATFVPGQGRKKPRIVESTPTVISEANAPAPPQNRAELFKAADVYKASLRQLLIAREAEATQAADRIAKLTELYQDGLISRVQLEASERELVEIRHRVEETRKQLIATDAVVVESIVESEAGSVAEFESIPKSRRALRKVAYIRFRGTSDWSVLEIDKIEKFFQSKFKRALPIAALGQSDLHTRWGYDHNNAVDLAVHPDSVEGRALMDYLSSQGVSFIAFRRAVPGSATGPHIHIGKSSQKLFGVR